MNTSSTDRKIFISNAPYAEIYIVFAKTDPAAPGTRGMSAFIVEKDTPGFSVGEAEHKLGIRGSSTPPLYFADCHIPADALLGGEGNGFKVAMLDPRRRPYRHRRAGARDSPGRPRRVGRLREGARPVRQADPDQQAVQWMFADMATEIDAARLLVYRAASCVDN